MSARIVQRYGPLELVFSSPGWVWLAWWDKKSGAAKDGSFWAPWRHTVGDWYLGSIGKKGYAAPLTGLMVREVDKANEILKPPLRFECIWTDRGTGSTLDGSVWRPIPPPGYVALGDVFTKGHQAPQEHHFACVRKTFEGRELVRRAEIGNEIWNDRKSGGKYGDVSVWEIITPPYPDGSEERLLVAPGTLTAVPNYDRPGPTDVTWVLDLPAVVETLSGPDVPKMNSYDKPVDLIAKPDRRVTVPYTMVKDDSWPEKDRILKTPFYKIERRRWFKTVMHRDNRNGSNPAEIGHRVDSGVTTERSKEFSLKTGITVGYEAGVQAPGGIASMKSHVSLSLELGYSTRTSVSILKSESKEQKLVIPAGKAGALWAQAHELIPLRANGDPIPGASDPLSFSIDSYVTGEYPPKAGVRHLADGTDVTAATLPAADPETG